MLQLVLLIECLCFAPADPADAAAVDVVASVAAVAVEAIVAFKRGSRDNSIFISSEDFENFRELK